MPIFEYRCESCGHQFEHLTRADREAVCPACAGQTLARQLSTFAVGAATPSRAGHGADASGQGTPCGSCGDPRGPGACSMN